jgi:hypothetical protein
MCLVIRWDRCNLSGETKLGLEIAGWRGDMKQLKKRRKLDSVAVLQICQRLRRFGETCEIDYWAVASDFNPVGDALSRARQHDRAASQGSPLPSPAAVAGQVWVWPLPQSYLNKALFTSSVKPRCSTALFCSEVQIQKRLVARHDEAVCIAPAAPTATAGLFSSQLLLPNFTIHKEYSSLYRNIGTCTKY